MEGHIVRLLEGTLCFSFFFIFTCSIHTVLYIFHTEHQNSHTVQYLYILRLVVEIIDFSARVQLFRYVLYVFIASISNFSQRLCRYLYRYTIRIYNKKITVITIFNHNKINGKLRIFNFLISYIQYKYKIVLFVYPRKLVLGVLWVHFNVTGKRVGLA